MLSRFEWDGHRVWGGLRTLGSALAVAALSVAAHGETADNNLKPFTASFAVEWKGLNGGTSTLSLKQTGPADFQYTSSSSPRGIFRLAFSDITTSSTLVIENGAVRPLHFRGSDGAADRAKDIALDFDWARSRITGTAEQKAVNLELKPGVQDSMSVQIALMVDLAAGRSPSEYSLIDKDEIKQFLYTREAPVRLKTALGEIDTIVYASRRANSSRVTRMWIAPSLGYVPVQAERRRDGKLELTMRLRTLKR